jgi:hypothetical protein
VCPPPDISKASIRRRGRVFLLLSLERRRPGVEHAKRSAARVCPFGRPGASTAVFKICCSCLSSQNYCGNLAVRAAK